MAKDKRAEVETKSELKSLGVYEAQSDGTQIILTRCEVLKTVAPAGMVLNPEHIVEINKLLQYNAEGPDDLVKRLKQFAAVEINDVAVSVPLHLLARVRTRYSNPSTRVDDFARRIIKLIAIDFGG